MVAILFSLLSVTISSLTAKFGTNAREIQAVPIIHQNKVTSGLDFGLEASQRSVLH